MTILLITVEVLISKLGVECTGSKSDFGADWPLKSLQSNMCVNFVCQRGVTCFYACHLSICGLRSAGAYLLSLAVLPSRVSQKRAANSYGLAWFERWSTLSPVIGDAGVGRFRLRSTSQCRFKQNQNTFNCPVISNMAELFLEPSIVLY